MTGYAEDQESTTPASILLVSHWTCVAVDDHQPRSSFCNKHFTHDLLGLSWLHFLAVAVPAHSHGHRYRDGPEVRHYPANIVEYCQHEEQLQHLQCYTKLSPLPVLKVQDFWDWAKSLHPTML